MPPKEELFVPFETRFRFGSDCDLQVVEWKNTSRGSVFRPAGATCDLLWFLPDFRLAEEPYRHKSELHYNRYLRWFYEHEQFFRLVSLNSPQVSQQTLAVVRPDACGLICGSYKHCANWKPNWNWGTSKSHFLRAPLTQLREQVSKAIEADPQEWRRAYEWAQMEDEQRFWSVVAWERGSRGEWQSLVRAAIQIASVQDVVEKEHRWGIFVLEKPRFALAPLHMLRGRSKGAVIKKLIPALERSLPLVELLENHFRPRIDYSRSGGRWNPPFYTVLRPAPIEGGKPNSHQLMEAVAIWREFGRESGQGPQVEACLRQLLR